MKFVLLGLLAFAAYLYFRNLKPAARAARTSAPPRPEQTHLPKKEIEPYALPATTDKRLVDGPPNTSDIEPGLRCDILSLARSRIRGLPANIEARVRMDLSECTALESLPDGIRTGSLILANCTALRALPGGLDVAFLDLTGCTGIIELPADLRLRGGHLILRDCAGILDLPDDLGEVSGLDLSGCMNVARLPRGLAVTSWIDLAGTQIQSLPERYAHVGLRWRGIQVSHRVVFEPHTLTPEEILGERNAEVRRVMMERFGYERLFDAAEAEVMDRDRDAGGERRLMRIQVENDEPLVCVAVQCPSTGHKFVLRVPPTTRNCAQAVAWTAGFDNPADYRPMRET